MASWVNSIEDLERLYGQPGTAALVKVTNHLTEAYRRWLENSRFCLLASVGPEGTDCSPRGDTGPVVAVRDARTLAMADWHGNQRIDSLRNIVRDGRVSLAFLVTGSASVVRINGMARLTAAESERRQFERDGAMPRSVIVIHISEVYFQCARAIKRSELWSAARPQGLPTPGDMLAEATSGEFDGRTYDAEWPGRAARTMW